MKPNTQMMRTLKVLHLLETTRVGRSRKEIHEQLEMDGLECTDKTLTRVFQLLEGSRIDIQKVKVAEGFLYKLNPVAKIGDNVHFSYKDIMAFYLTKKFLGHLKGSPLYQELDAFFMKLEKVFGKDCEAIQDFIGNFDFEPKMTWHNSVPAEVLDTVYHALEEGHALKFQYKAEGGDKAGEFAMRLVGPECLYFADAGVYLIAKDLSKDEPRTYALARMKDVQDVPEKPYDKVGIEPKDLFKDSFGLLNVGQVDEVEVLLEGPVAKYISERRWHESQKVVNREDGLHMFLNVKINREVARWILGLGDGATVLKPESLKKMVSELIDKIRDKYNKNKAA